MEFITNHWLKSTYCINIIKNQILTFYVLQTLIQTIHTNYMIFVLVAPVHFITSQAISYHHLQPVVILLAVG